MSDHEIQLLAIGAALGMDLMLLLQIAFGILDDHRDRKALRAARAQLGDHSARIGNSASTSTLADLRESEARR